MSNSQPQRVFSISELRARGRADALERLNRITGLQFEVLPELPVEENESDLPFAHQDGETLIYRALCLWSAQHTHRKDP